MVIWVIRVRVIKVIRVIRVITQTFLGVDMRKLLGY